MQNKKIKVLFFFLIFLVIFPLNLYAQKKWTFMVYLDGDNNLEGDGITDFMEMAEIGSNDTINIVVQFDRTVGESDLYDNWTKTHRFFITKDMQPTEANAISDWGDGQGGGREVNMADTQELVKFVRWAITNYPADSYILVMWNHGGGWRRRQNNQVADLPKLTKALIWDDGTPGHPGMKMPEFRQALQQLNSEGIKFDVIGFDICLAGMVEVVYEVKEFVNVVIASQITEPGGGWPYTPVLNYISGAANIKADSFAANVVIEYDSNYSEGVTQAAFKVDKISALKTAIDNFSDALINSNEWLKIKQARQNVQEMDDQDDYPNNTGIDLYHFANLISANIPSLSGAASAVKAAIDDFIIERRTAKAGPNFYGVAIFFPENIYNPVYTNAIQFGNDSKWADFLRRYWSYNTGQGPFGITMADLSDSSASGNYTISWTAGKDADSLKYYRLTEYRNAELIFSDNAENFNNWTNSGFSLNALHKKQGSYSFSSGSGYNQTKQITSGAIELPSTKSILMTYWCYSDNAGDNGGLKVNGINIDSISDKSISEEYRVVDLTQFAGQRVNLEFYNTFNNELGFDGDGYFIDDIKIWAYSGASFISQTISPSADSYQISDKAAGRYLYTIEGQDNQNNWGGVYGFKSISVPRCDVVIIDSAVQTENVIKGEQNSPVLIADITTYLDYDTITNFAIKNLGNANNADISKVKLWLAPNRNRAQFVGDEIFISNLEWNAGQAQWDTSAANLLPLVSGAARIIVTIDINSNANVNDTFVASVPQNTIASVRAPVGPATNKNESAIKTIQETYLKITKISELQSADVLRGDTNVTVMALKVIGNIPSDTITNFVVKNNGVMTNSDLDNVKLWFDADGDLRWSANDTYIGILNWNAAQSQWDTNSANIRLLSGVANILITIDINSNATFNRDFQALVQINSCTAQIIGTGPDTDLLNSGKFTLRSGKKWTVLVYINADNVTEADALVDFLEIAEVGSNNDMNIVAQLDRTPGNSTDYGDWEKTHRFYITQNMTPTETNAISNWGDGTGGREVNMADSNVLLDFINWTKNNYPADSYMLVIWNRLISKAVWRNNQQKTSVKRSIVTDWTYDGNGPVTMRMADFKAALEQSGIKFDVIGFDAPIAGTIEAAYDLKDLAYYMTASSKNIPAGGWPYNTILTSLKNNINTYTAANLASQIVERHFYKYSEAYENEEFVHAAYNLSAVQNLFDRINTFADELVKSQNDMAVAANIRADIVSNPQEIEDEDGPGDEPGSVDLYFYMNEFSSQSLSAAANLLANNVKSAIDAFVINRRSNPNATSEDYVNCRFVSIYFPFEYYNPVYSKVSTLGKNNKWSEFLRYFWTSKDQGPYNLQMAELSSTIPDSTLIINWSGVKDIDGISAYLLERYNNVNLLFSDNAEQGGANWILNGFSLTTKYKKSGQYSFASGEGFNTTKTMRTSAPINLPAGKKILLTYWYYADILNGDSATIAISADANNWLELKSYYDREISEEYETIDLSDSAGQSVYLRFSYGLNENLQFDGEGFFVDDIKIISYDDKISFAELSGGASAYTDTGLTPANYMYTISAKDSQNYYSDPQGFYIVNVNYAIDTPYINTISIYSGSMPNYYWTNDTPLIIADSTIAAGTTYFNGNYSQSLTFEIDWSSLSQKKLILGSNNFGNTNVSTTSAPWRLTYNNVSGAADTQITITVENYQSKTDTALIYMISDTFAPTIALQQPNNDSAILNNLIEFQWSSASDDKSGIKHYLLEISRQANFSEIDTQLIISNTANTTTVLVNQGEYYWRARLVDNVDNISSATNSETRAFRVDYTAPQINSVYVKTNTNDSLYVDKLGILANNEDTIIINGNKNLSLIFDIIWSDNIGQSKVSGSNNYGMSPEDTNGADSWILQYNISANSGDTVIYLYAIDKNNNQTSYKINIKEDKTAPAVVSLLQPVNNANITDDTYFIWSISTDALAGVRYYKIEIYSDILFNEGNLIYSEITANTTIPMPYSDLYPDTYFWRVVAYDNVLNYDTDITYNTFILANKLPKILRISAEANDGDFTYGNAKPYYTIAGNSIGDYVFSLKPSKSDTIYYNNSNLAGDSVGGQWYLEIPLSIKWSNGDNPTGDTLAYSAAFATNAGTFTYSAVEHDRTDTIIYRIPRNTYSRVEVSIIVYDSNDGDSDYYTIYFVQDTFVQLVNLTSPANDIYLSDTRVRFEFNNITDTVNIKKYYLLISSSPDFSTIFFITEISADTNTITADLSVSENKYYWTIAAEDNISNLNPFYYTNTNAINFDFTAPIIQEVTITSTEPSYSAYWNNQPLTNINLDTTYIDTIYINGNHSMNLSIKVKVSDNNFYSIYYAAAYNSNGYTSYTSNYTYNYVNIGVLRGDTIITIIATDKAGLKDTFYIQIKEDTVFSPTPATLLYPGYNYANAEYNELLRWSAAYDSLSGLKKYIIYADTLATFSNNFYLETTDTMARLSQVIDTSLLREGDWIYWKVSNIDNVGNVYQTEDYRFRLRFDMTAPNVYDIIPANGSVVPSANPIISVKFDDAYGIDVNSILFYVNGVRIIDELEIIDDYMLVYSAGDFAHGETVNIEFYVRDINNNGIWQNWSFMPKYKTPIVEITAPQDNINTSAQTILVTGTCENLFTGDSIFIYLNNELKTAIYANPDTALKFNWQYNLTIGMPGDELKVVAIDKFNQQAADTITINYFKILTGGETDYLSIWEDSQTYTLLTSTINETNIIWSASAGQNLQTTFYKNNNDTYLIITPRADFTGNDTLLLTLIYENNQNKIFTDTKLITVNVRNINDTPSIISTPVLNAVVNRQYSYLVIASDSDINYVGDTLTYTLLTAPANMTITKLTNTTARIDWTPAESQVGANTITVRVRDNNNAFVLQTFVVDVTYRPKPVYNLTAQVNNLNISLNWTLLNDTTITNYSVFIVNYASGLNAINLDNPYTTVDSQTNNVTLNNLAPNNEYLITVLSLNKNNVYADTAQSGYVVVDPRQNNGALVETKINLVNGFKVYGDKILFNVNIEKGQYTDLSKVLLQYRKLGNVNWDTMILNNSSNPINTNRTIPDNKLSVEWNIANLQKNTAYLIRSVATDRTNISEPNPISIMAYIINDLQNADYYTRTETQAVVVYQKIFTDINGTNKVIASAQGINSIDSSAIKTQIEAFIPNTAFSANANNFAPITLTILPPDKLANFNSALTVDPYGLRNPNFVVIIDTIAQITNPPTIQNILTTGEQTDLDTDVILRLYYQDEDNDGWIDNAVRPKINENWQTVWYRENITEPWRKLDNSAIINRSTDKNYIEFKTRHFTMFMLAPNTDPRNLDNSFDDFIVYPNPFIPSKNDKHGVPYSPGDRRSGIIFEGINYGTKIEIYTLKGQLVKKFINTNPEKFEWQWDTRNNSGTEVASGWYLYLVNKNGNKFTGKLAIIR